MINFIVWYISGIISLIVNGNGVEKIKFFRTRRKLYRTRVGIPVYNVIIYHKLPISVVVTGNIT